MHLENVRIKNKNLKKSSPSSDFWEFTDEKLKIIFMWPKVWSDRETLKIPNLILDIQGLQSTASRTRLSSPLDFKPS
jgi:hypothetical protein